MMRQGMRKSAKPAALATPAMMTALCASRCIQYPSPVSHHQVEAAAKLFAEELEGCAARYGKGHGETLSSARYLVKLLAAPGSGHAEEAAAVRAAYGLHSIEEAS